MTVGPDNKVVPKPVTLGGHGRRDCASSPADCCATDRVVITGLANPFVRPGAIVDAETRRDQASNLGSGRLTAMRLSHFFIDRPIFAAVLSIS